jgi:hypothetical protein
MPDFTSHVNLMPEDKITPAINDFTNTLMKVEMVKRAEDERKMAKLVDLTTVALGDMSAGDYTELQKQKEDFFNYTTSKYQESDKNGMRGNLSFSVQAELNAKKQSILRYAAKAEQDKKDIHDVMKLAATNKDVDQEETAANLRTYLKTPIAQRGDAWDIVSMNFNPSEYIKKNLVRIPQDSTEITGKFGAGTYNRTIYEANDALSQQMDWYKTRPEFKKGIDKEMGKMGIDSSSPDNVKNYLYNTYALPQAENSFKFQRHNQTNIYNSIGGGNGVGETAPSIRTVRNFLSDNPNVKKDGEDVSLRVSKSTAIPGGDASIVIKANNYFNLSEYKGPQTTPEDIDINGGTVESYPVVWITDTKGKNGKYYLADDKWLATHPEYEKKVEYKPYIVGQNKKTVTYQEDGKDKSTVQIYQYAIPADKDNVNKLNANIPKTQPKFKFSDTEMDFSGNANVPVTNVDSQTWITTVKTLKEKYKWTPEQIAKYKKDNKIQVN